MKYTPISVKQCIYEHYSVSCDISRLRSMNDRKALSMPINSFFQLPAIALSLHFFRCALRGICNLFYRLIRLLIAGIWAITAVDSAGWSSVAEEPQSARVAAPMLLLLPRSQIAIKLMYRALTVKMQQSTLSTRNRPLQCVFSSSWGCSPRVCWPGAAQPTMASTIWLCGTSSV